MLNTNLCHEIRHVEFHGIFWCKGCIAPSGQAHSSERDSNSHNHPRLRASGVLVSRNEFWREATIRARSRSKATEIKEAYFSYRSRESRSEAPSRASCGMFWVDLQTETQERVCCVTSVHIAGALACTRLTYPLRPSVSGRKLKPRFMAANQIFLMPLWSAASEASEHQSLAQKNLGEGDSP